jgi:hypothetical protein
MQHYVDTIYRYETLYNHSPYIYMLYHHDMSNFCIAIVGVLGRSPIKICTRDDFGGGSPSKSRFQHFFLIKSPKIDEQIIINMVDFPIHSH